MRCLYIILLLLALFWNLAAAEENTGIQALRQKAEAGDASSQYDLARLYLYGKGVDRDDKRAFELFLRSAEQGNAGAQASLGACYRKGLGVPKDNVKSFMWYEKSAGQGNADGQCGLGFCYDEGSGVVRDYSMAVKWYSLAAEQGNAKAQYNLALCYEYGKGVSKDHRNAFELFTKSATQGIAEAEEYLGFLYEQGTGTAKDYSRAFQWYAKAAEKGNVFSQRHLGIFYGSGKGVSADRQKAFEWFEKAAAQNDELSSMQMACYHFGTAGFKVEPLKAMAYLEKSADRGSSLAQMICACAYSTGTCVLVDDCTSKVVVGVVPADTDKSIRYAKMGVGSKRKSISALSGFLLLAGYGKKGDLKGAMQAGREFPMILFAICAGYLVLLGGFVITFAVILWIYSKSRTKGCDGGPWRLFDFFALCLLLVPLALITQIFLLLPFHILTNAMLQTVFLFGFGAGFFALVLRMRGVKIGDAYGFRFVSSKAMFLWALAFMVGIYSFELSYQWGCGLLGIELKPQFIADLLASKSLTGIQLGLVFLMCGIAVPVVEELVFRGIIYQSLRSRMRPWIAICLSSAVFASLHMSLSFFIIIFAMGVILAYSFEKTRSLYVPIGLHCINNSVMVCLTLLS